MNYKIKLKSIRNFIFDVDGVLTDGTVMLDGSDYVRTVHSRDSYALQYACKVGFKVFLITGGTSNQVKIAYEALGVTEVHLRSSNKLEVFNSLQQKYDLDPLACLYMGDDIPDIPVMRAVGLATAPHDASLDTRLAAAYVSPCCGGKGAVRDVIEQTLRVQDRWMLEEAYYW